MCPSCYRTVTGRSLATDADPSLVSPVRPGSRARPSSSAPPRLPSRPARRGFRASVSAPAERSAEIGGRELARGRRGRRPRAAARVASSGASRRRTGGRARRRRSHQPLLLLDDAGIRQHERALKHGDARRHLLLVGADERPQLGPGGGPFRERRLGDLELQRRELGLAEVLRGARCGRSARRAPGRGAARRARSSGRGACRRRRGARSGSSSFQAQHFAISGVNDVAAAARRAHAQSTSRVPAIASQRDGSTRSAPGRSAAMPTRSIHAAAPRSELIRRGVLVELASRR